MRRLGLIPLLLIILFSFFLGATAAHTLVKISDSHLQLKSNELCLPSQCNFIVVVVNDLQISNPRLFSVWGLFMNVSNPPTLLFKPLYQLTPTNDTNINLLNSFAFSKKEGLSPTFIAAIKAFNFRWQGYLVVDQFAMNALVSQLTGNAQNASPTPLPNPNNPQAIAQQGQSTLNQICKNLSAPVGQTRVVNVKWSDLIPEHLFTNLDFTIFMTQWERLAYLDQPAICEILLAQ